MCAGIFVYYEIAYDWSDGSVVVVKGAVEVRPSWNVKVESGLLEDIEGELVLFEEEVSELFWEGVIDAL